MEGDYKKDNKEIWFVLLFKVIFWDDKREINISCLEYIIPFLTLKIK